ncbi:hypothetical protein HG530_015309 [Fusarium avenaceum]|nr:hypothetical protein HG530_015309 [Fusarium avenaceum]
MCYPVNNSQIKEDSEQSYCYAVDKTALLQSEETYPLSHAPSRLVSEENIVEDSLGIVHSGSPAGGKVKCLGVNQDRENNLSVKDVFVDPNPERNKYVHERIGSTTEAIQVEDLEKQIRCLTVTLGDKPGRAVSPRIEEAYAQGESLTPPEIEFSEDSDMEDDYWTWDQDTQRFRHWDGELGEWVCFPERFD